MGSALVALATTTLASSSATVTFSSISGAYRDLVLVFDGTSTVSETLFCYLNGDTNAANYSRVNMRGTGSAAASSSGNDATVATIEPTRCNATISIMDYTATDKHKTLISRGSSTTAWVVANASRWANTAAVTSLQLSCGGTTFAAGSTFSLYGVLA